MDADTAATLLLCSRFSRLKDTAPVLEPREYHRLLSWLSSHDLTPGDLLQSDGIAVSDSVPPIAADRLAILLARGGMMAVAVEGWESRGLWVMSRYDEGYPERLKGLGPGAPPLLYGAGDRALFERSAALAIVGSRDVDSRGTEFTTDLGRACARQQVLVVSGAARGVDSLAMGAALEGGGVAIGVVADSLQRTATSGGNQGPLIEGQLLLISPYDPAAGFNVGNAMGRNKHIYALADAAVVVQATEGSGGTWAGAVEALRRGTVPVFTRIEESIPAGNLKLLELGAHAFPDEAIEDLPAWLQHYASPEQPLVQGLLL